LEKPKRIVVGISYTVYCKKSVADVTPEQMLAGVNEADLETLAESYDVPDSAIRSARDGLGIVNVDAEQGFHLYRLVYRPGDVRQIDVQRWLTTEAVRDVLAEVVEDLEVEGHALLPRIRTHFEGVVDIVDASFGFSEGEVMAPILASEITRWLAEQYVGIIRAADDSWWTLGTIGQYVSMTT